MSAEDFKVDATYAIIQDPSLYNYKTHGPPYLPTTTASVKPLVKGMLRQAAVGKAAHFYKVVQAQIGPYAQMPHGELASVLVLLRALSMVHQTNHWATNGPTFYSDHIMFDRLYGGVLGEIDSVAERAIGLGGPQLVVATTLAKATYEILVEMCDPQPVEPDADKRAALSLQAELRFLLMMQMVAKGSVLSRGTDNLLAGIEDKHEEHVYLLKQRMGSSSGDT